MWEYSFLLSVVSPWFHDLRAERSSLLTNASFFFLLYTRLLGLFCSFLSPEETNFCCVHAANIEFDKEAKRYKANKYQKRNPTSTWGCTGKSCELTGILVLIIYLGFQSVTKNSTLFHKLIFWASYTDGQWSQCIIQNWFLLPLLLPHLAIFFLMSFLKYNKRFHSVFMHVHY